MIKLYLAGPCFSEADRASLLLMAKELEKTMHYIATEEKQVQVYLPFRDAGDWTTVGAEAVFVRDLQAIDNSDIVVAVLDGADVDSGTAAEMGYAWARGKPIFAVCTDMERRRKQINAFVIGLVLKKTDAVAANVKRLQGAIQKHIQGE